MPAFNHWAQTAVQSLSVVIPVLNDGGALALLLKRLYPMLRAGGRQRCEVIVVDGGSRDSSAAIARQHGARVVSTPASRGVQLRAGCDAAGGDWLWLLHADSVPDRAPLVYLQGLRSPAWGRFDVRFTGRHPLLAVIAAMMNMRSAMTGICTGDQGMFVHRSLLTAVGGFPAQPIMEDIELSRRLRRLMWPRSPLIALTTSSRRWESQGMVRTVVTMWGMRLRYWFGADPEVLAAEYYST